MATYAPITGAMTRAPSIPALPRRSFLGAMAGASTAAAISVVASASIAAASTFQAALHRYVQARDAHEHDWRHGALAAANDLYDQRTDAWFAIYRGKDKAPPEIERVWSGYYAEILAAEAINTETFAHLRWDAAEELCACPAPSIGALLRKVTVLSDEIDTEELMEAVKADLKRLASGGRS